MASTESGVRLGLRQNRLQFAPLVLVNAFVGTMVGVERSVLSLLAETEFGISSATAALSFIVAFGLTKAIANLVAGDFADRIGRRRILIAGWLFALPVPVILGWAPTWNWVIFANLLLGVNQGLAWSATVIMKIDLVGPKQRGLAMGLNEFAGYVAVAAAALGAGYMAAHVGVRSGPVWIGGTAAIIGLAITLLFVQDTAAHVELERVELEHGEHEHVEPRARQTRARRGRCDRDTGRRPVACRPAGTAVVCELGAPAAFCREPGWFHQQPERRRCLGAVPALPRRVEAFHPRDR